MHGGLVSGSADDPIDSDATTRSTAMPDACIMHGLSSPRALARLVSVCHSEVRTGTHARVVANSSLLIHLPERARPRRTFGGRVTAADCRATDGTRWMHARARPGVCVCVCVRPAQPFSSRKEKKNMSYRIYWKDVGRDFRILIQNKLQNLSENYETNLMILINLSLAHVDYCST
jgi:hypothetical protein